MRAIATGISVFMHLTSGWSQSFGVEAKLPPIEEDGFYRVFISPDVAVHLTATFSNIRIYDNEGNEIPYLQQNEGPDSNSQEFREYEILEKKLDRGCCTSLILHNPDQNLVSSINLVVKNADVTKEAVLLGSDDQLHWFALKQRFILHPTTNSSGTSEIKIVDFPLSNYSYYSLQINDSTSAPLNILGAGYFENVIRPGKYTEVPLRNVTSTDSLRQKETYVHFQFDTLRLIDLLKFSMKGSAYFLRRASLFVRKERALKTGAVEGYYDLIREIELSSTRPAVIELRGIKADDLLLVIENEDNPPLEIDYGKVYQLNRYLVSFLKKEKQYAIKIGDEKLNAPVYDLPFFKDRIPANPPIVTIGEFTVLEKKKSVPNFTFFTTKAFIWAAIVFVIVILGLMSVRLLKDLNSSGKK